MIWHVLTWTVADGKDVAPVLDELESLEKIDSVLAIQTGPLLGDESGTRYGLVVAFDDRDGLQAYIDDPDHQAVVPKLRDCAEPGSISIADILPRA